MTRPTDHILPSDGPVAEPAAVSAEERLKIVLQCSGERSYNALARRLGLKHGENLYRIKRGCNGISSGLALRIRRKYPSFSLGWLLGEPADPDASEVPGEASGSPDSFGMPLLSFHSDLHSLARVPPSEPDRRVPFPAWLCRGTEAAVLCRGDALAPRILPGDCMFLARTPVESLVFGRAYVVIVGAARLCRIIRRGESPESVRLVSLKPGKYDEIALPKTDIDGLYRICGTFRHWAG